MEINDRSSVQGVRLAIPSPDQNAHLSQQISMSRW